MSTVHGEVDIRFDNNILTLEVVGPWNIEFFHLLHQRLAEFAPQLKNKAYGVMLILIGEALPVAEAVEFHIQFLKRVRTSGIAVILSKTSAVGATEAIFQHMYGSAQIEHQFFMDKKEATAWLINQINQAEKE